MVDQINHDQFRDSIEAFYFAYREFTAKPDQILGQRGLNRVHHRILYFVGKYPDIGIGELLKILKVSKQALNAPLRQLIEMNLVTRVYASHDRRVKCLRLTASGERLEHSLTQAQTKLLGNIFDQYSKQVQDHWIEVMKCIGDSSEK